MTKLRRPASIHSALAGAINALSPEDIKAITGKSMSFLYQCADEDNERNITWEDAARLQAFMERHNIPHQFDIALDNKISDLNHEDHKPTDLHTGIAQFTKHAGDLADLILEATSESSPSGKNISDCEMRALAEALAPLEALIKRLPKDAKSCSGSTVIDIKTA